MITNDIYSRQKSLSMLIPVLIKSKFSRLIKKSKTKKILGDSSEVLLLIFMLLLYVEVYKQETPIHGILM